ncbi:MAG: hypothetical protein GXP27_18145, partial [Planctomycetes bacterium]|nr:hypothetical protein [Planctomycetota bacterium]
PQTGADHFMAAVAYQELDSNETAETHFEAAVTMEPSNESYRRAYADFLRNCGRWEDAIRQYQLCRLISKTPELYDRLVETVRRERDRGKDH